MKFDPSKIASQLATVAEGDVQIGKSLAPYTSYNIGGPTAVWVSPVSEDEVGRILEIIHRHEVPLFVLGRGSNVLLSDRGWDGVTLYLGENLSAVAFDGGQARVLAGSLLPVPSDRKSSARPALSKVSGMMDLLFKPPALILALTTAGYRSWKMLSLLPQFSALRNQIRTYCLSVSKISWHCALKSNPLGIPLAAVCLSAQPAIMPVL